MNRNNLTTAVIAAIAGVAGIANMASAVNLNPDGLGQVLLYPYYTVNNDGNSAQQTLLSVVNTDTVNGKAVKVRFLEGYNSREVFDFNLFLSPADVWTANVFSLADDTGSAGAGTGAGIFTTDNSCTSPALNGDGTLSNGSKFAAFRNFAYSGSNSDGGPVTEFRTREGHFEIILMADIVPVVDEPLFTDIKHVSSLPPDCADAEAEFETEGLAQVTSGLFGSGAIVDVQEGTFYSYNADAVDGFTKTTLVSSPVALTPNLAFATDAANPFIATSYVFNNGALITSPYNTNVGAFPSADAVSSLFVADNVYNEYVASGAAIQTDWVVNFPTKRFYVDNAPGGVIFGATAPIPPFTKLFNGTACEPVRILNSVYDREENVSTPAVTYCPSPPPPEGCTATFALCYETNVISFRPTTSTGPSDVLFSNLVADLAPLADAGWAKLGLSGNGHDMRPANANAAGYINTFHGLPVTGFEAVKYVNGNVSVNGVNTLSNYSGVFRHRISRNCTSTGGALSPAVCS